MAPAVVDSEDEDAEILVPDDRDTHRELSSSINAKMGQTFDGSNDRRTGSTGKWIFFGQWLASF